MKIDRSPDYWTLTVIWLINNQILLRILSYM